MRLNILIAGKAGQGMNEMANSLSRAILNSGLYVFNYRDYGSYITGGHNFNILCIGDNPVYSHDLSYDIAILLDEKSYDKHKTGINKKTIILTNQKKKYNSKTLSFTIEEKKVENVYFAAILFKILGLEKKHIRQEVEKTFAGKSLLKLDLQMIDKAYVHNYKFNMNLCGNSTGRYLTGAEAVGIGAIESGLSVYYGYPMTPATTLLTFLALNQEKYDYFVFEPENELAIANIALGSSFSGARVMIGSSGGGYDLMTEAISMEAMTELPLVVYLASRPGPSSGTPTFSMQQDLNLALHSGHGDIIRVVACPGDTNECYRTSKELFYLSEKYSCLGIILVDKHVAESGYTQEIENYDLFIGKKGKYPGKEIIRNNSYSHTPNGEYTEDPEELVKMFDRLNKKKELLRKEVEKFETFKVYGNKNSKNVIVGFGSTKGAIMDSLDKLKNWKYIHIIYVEPFPDKLISELNKSGKIYVVENNSTGQLANLIESKVCKKINKRILKYDARPFTPADVIRGVKS